VRSRKICRESNPCPQIIANGIAALFLWSLNTKSPVIVWDDHNGRLPPFVPHSRKFKLTVTDPQVVGQFGFSPTFNVEVDARDERGIKIQGDGQHHLQNEWNSLLSSNDILDPETLIQLLLKTMTSTLTVSAQFSNPSVKLRLADVVWLNCPRGVNFKGLANWNETEQATRYSFTSTIPATRR
jgi:hypothetical protein